MYKLTDGEKLKITEAMQIVAEDLHSLWEKSKIEELIVRIRFEDGNREEQFLHICENSIFLTDEKESTREEGRIRLVREGKFIPSQTSQQFQYDITFIENYEINRPRIIEAINESIEQKNSFFKKIENIIGFCSQEKRREKQIKEASIELTLPPSNNQHEVAITKENGRTVGVIDFGERMIKIITDGDISLVRSKQESPKVKSK